MAALQLMMNPSNRRTQSTLRPQPNKVLVVVLIVARAWQRTVEYLILTISNCTAATAVYLSNAPVLDELFPRRSNYVT